MPFAATAWAQPSPPASLHYTSALSHYQPYKDAAPSQDQWRQANEQVKRTDGKHLHEHHHHVDHHADHQHGRPQ